MHLCFSFPPKALVIIKFVHLEMHAPLEDAWGAVPLMDLFFDFGLTRGYES